MRRFFSFLLCFSLLSMRSICACESMQVDLASNHHHEQEDQDCHGHEGHGEQSSKPSHHACICPDHGNEAIVSQAPPLVSHSTVIAVLNWNYIDLSPSRHATDLLVYYHSPPNSLPLYLTQATLLL